MNTTSITVYVLMTLSSLILVVPILSSGTISVLQMFGLALNLLFWIIVIALDCMKRRI